MSNLAYLADRKWTVVAVNNLIYAPAGSRVATVEGWKHTDKAEVLVDATFEVEGHESFIRVTTPLDLVAISKEQVRKP